MNLILWSMVSVFVPIHAHLHILLQHLFVQYISFIQFAIYIDDLPFEMVILVAVSVFLVVTIVIIIALITTIIAWIRWKSKQKRFVVIQHKYIGIHVSI